MFDAQKADLLAALRSRGVEVRLDGSRLRVETDAPLTDEQRAWLRQHKAELLTALTGPPELTADDHADIHEAIEERAAIQEFDGGLPREHAEQQARAAMRVYSVLAALPEAEPRWVTLLAPGCDLDAARYAAHLQFGADRVLAMHPKPTAENSDNRGLIAEPKPHEPSRLTTGGWPQLGPSICIDLSTSRVSRSRAGKRTTLSERCLRVSAVLQMPLREIPRAGAPAAMKLAAAIRHCEPLAGMSGAGLGATPRDLLMGYSAPLTHRPLPPGSRSRTSLDHRPRQ